MKPTKLLQSFLLTAGSSLLAISSASAQTPLVANGNTVALSVTSSNSTNYSITGTTETGGFNGVIRNTSGNNTLSGNIVLNSPSGNIRFDTTGGNLIFAGNISQTGTSRALLLTPISGSTMTVNNAMALNGGEFRTGAVTTTGTAGTVVLNAASGSGIGNTIIFQGSTLQLGITNALNTAANLTIGATGGPSFADIGTFNLAGFNQTVNALVGATIGAGNAAASNRRVINTVVGTSTLTVGNGGGSGTFNGQINTGTGNIQLIKTGAGNQTLSASNSYTGGTRIDDGTLTLGHATDTLANTGAVNVNGGTLALGTNSDTVGAVTLTSGSITSSTGVLTGSSYAVQSGSVSAILGGSGSLTKSTAGTVTLSGANTYTGGTQIDAGTLTLGHATNTLTNAGAVNVNGGTLALGSNSDTVGAVTLTSGSITGSGVLTGSSYDVRSGNVSAILGGSGALTKSTSGTVTLTGANTYSGATNVNEGMLHVSGSGSINGSSGITVNGGHFKYNSSTNLTAPLTFTSGTVSGTNLAGVSLTVGTGDTISPGNSPGTMNVANQTWAAGGTYLWELYDATGVAGTGWDLLAGTGTLDITASLGSEFIIDLTTLAAVAPDVLGNAINFNASNSYAWLIADFASVTGFNPSDFTIDATGFTNAPLSGSFGISLGGVGTVPGDSSQVYLTYTYIPEPGAALLGGLGVLTLLRRRRSA